MAGFNIITGNRLEVLADALAEAVTRPQRNPLAQELIVVQSRGMAAWISMAIAARNGICANFRFPFPNALLRDIYSRLITGPGPDPDPDLLDFRFWEPELLALRIMEMLPLCVREPGFESLGTYLSDDADGLKHFQLSVRIAGVFDRYLVFRPEMVLAWEAGRARHWQARLWRDLVRAGDGRSPARLGPLLLEAVHRRHVDPGLLPERVSLFGISYLPPFHLRCFAALGRVVEVNLFVPNPCMAFWADVVSDAEIRRVRQGYPGAAGAADLHLEKGNRLLASLGVQGRDFFSLIGAMDGEVHERFQVAPGHDMLSHLQADILTLRDSGAAAAGVPGTPEAGRPVAETDTSVQVHACHSPWREIQVLYDHLLAMFEENPDLAPGDILVMAPDMDAYAPYVRAVFDTQSEERNRIPYTLADQRWNRQGRVIAGFLDLLGLPGGRLGVQEVLSLLDVPDVMANFKLSEPEVRTVEQWLRDTHVHWGLDQQSRREAGFPDFPDNTWRAGLRRLLLGHAMAGKGRRSFAGILPYDAIEGSHADTLGKFVEFVETVAAAVGTLNGRHPLGVWAGVLSMLLERVFGPAGDGASEQERLVLQEVLAGMTVAQERFGCASPVGLAVVRSFVGDRVDQAPFGSGFVAGGVTFCSLLPMRSIPAQVICLIGMDDGAFPRDTRGDGFDLMARYPKPGDRSRRNDDRYLFLEAILSSRLKLYISYIGQSIEDNKIIPSSVLVSELIDHLTGTFAVTEDRLVLRHPLQAFSPAYFTGDGRLFSYSRTLCTAAGRMGLNLTPEPFVHAPLSPPSPDVRSRMALHELCAFFSHPARFLLRNRLGVVLDEPPPVLDDREMFQSGPLERFIIGKDWIDMRRSGAGWEDFLRVSRAGGGLAPGNVGEVTVRGLVAEAETFAQTLDRLAPVDAYPSLEVDLDVAGCRVLGRLPARSEAGLVHGRYARVRAMDLLTTWVLHLVLNALPGQSGPKTSFFMGKDKAYRFRPADGALALLETLVDLFWKGWSSPLHFFPETSRVFVLKSAAQGPPETAALKAALNRWQGEGFIRGEGQDPYYHKCFRDMDPLDDAFVALSRTVFCPLLDQCAAVDLGRIGGEGEMG